MLLRSLAIRATIRDHESIRSRDSATLAHDHSGFCQGPAGRICSSFAILRIELGASTRDCVATRWHLTVSPLSQQRCRLKVGYCFVDRVCELSSRWPLGVGFLSCLSVPRL